MSRAVAVIERATLVALACHVSPDGDALGSTLALHHSMRAAGRASVASFPEPFVIAPHYRDLPGLELLVPSDEFPPDPAVMLTFDCGSASRLGELEHAAKSAGELVVVDHHVSNTRYGTINLIDAEAAASAVITYRLIEALGLPLTREAAICLYAGLVCDTGRFQYESTTSEVLRLAARLLEFDVPVARLGRTLFDEHRFAYLQLLADVLSHAHLVPERRFVWAVITQADLAKHGVAIDETEGLIDIVRRTAEAEITCVVKEEADATLRVSLRSLGATDVSQLAMAEGGGGHRFAAGFTATGSIPALIERITNALPAE
jgi:phosphoesterase RecJ-like protein